MLKKSLFLALIVVLMLSVFSFAAEGDQRGSRGGGGRERWRLGVQAYSFRMFTLFEAIDKSKELGLTCIEMYPGQKLSKAKPDVKTTPDMPADARAELKNKLKESGVKAVNYGVINLTKDEKQCREVFEFAKDMGIETIVSEPSEDALDTIEKLCKEYKIRVAIHNHPTPSHYWNPDTVLAALEGRSRMIGACADTGHWTRSGLDPLEQIKKLKGRIVSLHLKDLKDFGTKNTHDVPWGTGKSKAKEILEELNKQGFRGVFSIEYEHNWENSMPEIKKCVEFFNEVKSEMKPVERQGRPGGSEERTEGTRRRPRSNNEEKK